MSAMKITFENKAGIQNDSSVDRKNKVVDEDMNEIKRVVNSNSDELKKATDKLNVFVDSPLKWQGTVENYEDLFALENVNQGEIYTVLNENKNYAWNKIEWIEYSDSINVNNLITHKYSLEIDSDKTAGEETTIPCYYKVGEDVLDVYLNGERLLKSSDDSGTDGHYLEVGDSGSISNKIKTTTDWNLEEGDVLDLVIRGEYNVTVS